MARFRAEAIQRPCEVSMRAFRCRAAFTALASFYFALGSSEAVESAAPQLPECTCRNFEKDVPLGARLCILTPQGRRMATCVREQNVTSWQVDAESCADLSQLSAPEP